MKKILKFSLLALAMLSAAACTKDIQTGDELINEKDGVVTVFLSRETEYGNDWIYWSFDKRAEVEVKEEEHENDLSWDIAFNRYNIRTNSGLSGKGKGGALDTEKINLSEVSAVPAGDFTTDEKGKITSRFTGSGVEEVESTYNMLLKNAIKFQGPPPTYTPNNHVYIVKTADGKYAKVQFLSFYSKRGEAGYMSFRYVYQPDGSTTFTK